MTSSASNYLFHLPQYKFLGNNNTPLNKNRTTLTYVISVASRHCIPRKCQRYLSAHVQRRSHMCSSSASASYCTDCTSSAKGHGEAEHPKVNYRQTYTMHFPILHRCTCASYCTNCTSSAKRHGEAEHPEVNCQQTYTIRIPIPHHCTK